MNRLGSKTGRLTLWMLRLVLSGVFIYAGVAKIRDPRSFAESIDAFRLLPPDVIDPVALGLPPMEILAGILALLGGRLRRVGAFALLAMLGVFMMALAQARARGLNVDCGCFGAEEFDVLSSTKNLWTAMARDLALGVAAWLLYVAAKQPQRPLAK